MDYVKNNKAFVVRSAIIDSKPSSDLYILRNLATGIHKVAGSGPSDDFAPYIPCSYGTLLKFEVQSYVLIIFGGTDGFIYFRHGYNYWDTYGWHYDWKKVAIGS